MKSIKRAVSVLLSPGISAVVVEGLEVLSGDEFAAVNPGLDGSQSPQDADLLHVTHHRRDLQSLEFGVDGVQSSDQVFEKQVKRLGQADELVSVHRERGHLGTPKLHHPALIILRGIFNRGWGRVHGLSGQIDAGAGIDQIRSEQILGRRLRRRS